MTQQMPTMIPHLVVRDAAAALEFYASAFGATEPTERMIAEDGKRILHAEILVNGALIFVRDHFPEACMSGGQEGDQGGAEVGVAPPDLLRGTPVTLHLNVSDCDAWTRRAEAAGARVTMPPEDMFWGMRFSAIVDPFGHSWSLGHALSPAA